MSTQRVDVDHCAHRFLARLRTLLHADSELRSISAESPVSVTHAALLQLASEVMIGIPDTVTNDDLDDYPQVAALFQCLYATTVEFVLADGGKVTPFEVLETNEGQGGTPS